MRSTHSRGDVGQRSGPRRDPPGSAGHLR